jgi:hypothetical protein
MKISIFGTGQVPEKRMKRFAYLQGRLDDYYEQQARKSPFLRHLISFLIFYGAVPGQIEKMSEKVNKREWLLWQLQGMEDSCVHPLNCDALAWGINSSERPTKQIFFTLDSIEMMAWLCLMVECIYAAVSLKLSFGEEFPVMQMQR